jgi:hypothetical protein
MDNNFKQFVNSLKGNSTSTHLDLDATWNIPNLLLNSNELLLIILTKTTMIPFIQDYTTISNDLGLTQAQSSSIQETNALLLVLHKMIQKYCIQQFAIGSMMKSEMDNIILSAPEIEDIQSIDDMINYMENFKKTQQTQTGGMNITGKFLTLIGKLILFTFLITPISLSEVISSEKTSDNQIQLVLNGKNLIQPYNPQIVDISLEDFSQSLQEKTFIKSRRSSSVNNMIVKYDDDIEKHKTRLLNQFLSVFSAPQSGIDVLKDIIDKFNSGLSDFSQGAEGICLELMDKANDKGVFGHFMDFDTMDKTNQKIEDIEIAVNKYNSEITQQTITSSVATFATSVGTFALTGDYTEAMNQAAPYILSLGSSLIDSLTNTQNIEKEQKEFLSEKQISLSPELTPTQKIELENKIYHFSKVYCSYGYNLQLQLNGTDIDVIGDKIEYNWILNVIALLENNIDLKITKSSLNKVLNKFELNALVSLKQRVQILKAITNKLYHIVNFSMQSQISKLNIQPTADSLEKIDVYFNNQLQDLLNMLESVKKQFPKREEDLKQESLLVEAEKKLNETADALKLQETEANIASQQRQNAIVQLVSEMKAQNVSASWIASETIYKSYINLAVNATGFMGESLGNIVEAVGEAGLNVPLGAVKSILDFINKILWLLVTHPAGWVLLGSGLMVFTFWFGGIIGVIRIFKKSGELFVTITYGSIMFVYKLIKTPFGWIYRKQDVIVVPQIDNADISDEKYEIANILLQLSAAPKGGKKRTKRQHQRNNQKVKKTRRKNKTKSKNTTKRRNKSTKYSRRRK